MNKRSQFDVLQTPLRPGRTLIEASAGTGKTYTIAGIVLRLILEHDLPVEQILVTTYTELATAELRERIRRLLRDTLTAFETGHSPNEFSEALKQRNEESPNSIGRLRLALQTFDEAAIYTIHGFCQRLLKDRAFESGTLFDAELITDESIILSEIVDDFWRREFYTANPLVIAAVSIHKLTPATLRRDLDDFVKKPTIEIRPTVTSEEELRARERLSSQWAVLRRSWLSQADEVRAIFQRPTWANKPYKDSADVSRRFTELDLVMAGAGVDGNSEAILFFSASALTAGTRAHQATPKHDFFQVCEIFVETSRTVVLATRAKFLSWARAEMIRRKLHRNVLFYDDLLGRLLDSLGKPGAEALVRTIRERFRAALIDEFQDTDPVQAAIFDRIYAGSEASLFFIGDPKQSIYGFRGADIFTYIQAAQKADRHFTLGKNWRSETGLVEAVNTIFGLETNPFRLEGVSFEPVDAAGEADKKPLTFNGQKLAPFQLWLAEAEIKNWEAERQLPQILASGIVALLQSNAKLGDRKVAARDLSILVHTNREAQMVQEALLNRGVPTVIYGAANVFKSREAKELRLILAGVIEPGQESKVRAALATEAFGLTSEELARLAADDQRWERYLQQFQRYHELWRESGFIQMLRTAVLEQGVRARLLSYTDGERRLTNMLHLGELLHRMCVEGQLGMTGLLKRLSELIVGTDMQDEEYEVRLESDEDAARVITVYKSKGLQYPIVFCPFSWKDPWGPKDENVIFHENDKIVLDLAGTETSRNAQREERLQDRMRLLYVALTRAEHRCNLVWGNFKGGHESAPAHLFGPWQSDGVARLDQNSNIASSPLPQRTESHYRSEEQVTPTLQARSFERALDRTYGIASFTRLLSDQLEEPEIPEDDAIESLEPEITTITDQTALEGMAAFPRGTSPGTCLHHIFEELVFDQPAELDSLVRAKLQAFGIYGQDEVVSAMVNKVLAVQLDPAQPSLRLSAIPPADRLSELEFYFPLSRINHHKFSKIFPDKRLRFQSISGFMKGFIDLIFRYQDRFYIVDWKSNWLGPNPESYSHTAMDVEMENKFYYLQLSIYTVALHRFLGARMPGYDYETHFGGVFYLFLRGIDPARPESGIWRTRPAADFIERLSRTFDHDS